MPWKEDRTPPAVREVLIEARMALPTELTHGSITTGCRYDQGPTCQEHGPRKPATPSHRYRPPQSPLLSTCDASWLPMRRGS